MSVLRRISRGPTLQRLGKRAGRLGKHLLGRLLDAVLPTPPNQPVAALTGVRRVLLVRPNFRIGNTLLTTPLVPALHERFPGARLEILTADTTESLLEHLPIDAVHVVSRLFVLLPWRFVGLFRRLRRAQFDVAVDGGMGSFSGGLYSYLTGARQRVGVSGAADRFLTVRLDEIRADHAYDYAPAFARELGVSCADHPIYAVAPQEEARATEILAAAGCVRDGEILPFAALFVGGHLEKRWPPGHWLELVARLECSGARFVILLGPEERALGRRLEAQVDRRARVIPPGPLRTLAALLGRSSLVLTTDSGPMHLSVALGRPTIGLFETPRSLRYRPRGEQDLVLMNASVQDAHDAMAAHSQWRRLIGDGAGGE